MRIDEGGTDNEEFRVAAVKDRVDTTMQVWMGLTMGCAKCHSHKYDPISHTDYYSFYALFNQTEDADLYTDAPTMELLSPREKEERKQLQANIEKLNTELVTLEATDDSANAVAEKNWRVAAVQEAVAKDGAKLTAQKDGVITASDKAPPEDTYVVTLTLAAGTHRVTLDATGVASGVYFARLAQAVQRLRDRIRRTTGRPGERRDHW